MKGMIDNEGILCIKRGKSRLEKCRCMKSTGFYCQRGSDEITLPHYCQDSCPLFGEPEIKESVHVIDGEKISVIHKLTICENRTLIFEEFTDERR